MYSWKFFLCLFYILFSMSILSTCYNKIWFIFMFHWLIFLIRRDWWTNPRSTNYRLRLSTWTFDSTASKICFSSSWGAFRWWSPAEMHREICHGLPVLQISSHVRFGTQESIADGMQSVLCSKRITRSWS